MKKKLNILYMILIAVVIIAGLVLFINYKPSQNVTTTPKERSNSETSDRAFIQSVLEQRGETLKGKLENIGELTTAEYSFTHYSEVEKYQQIKDICSKLWGTKATCAFTYDGTIKAGIKDFCKIQVVTDPDTYSIQVILPKMEITDSYFDENSFQLVNEQKNLFTKISYADIQSTYPDILKEEEDKAIEKGVLNWAGDNAVLLMQNLIDGIMSEAGEQDINIVVSIAD